MCIRDSLYAVAKGLPVERLTRKTLPQTQVPGDVAGALTLLDAGESSAAVTRGGWRLFLMLCSRGAAAEDMPSRDEAVSYTHLDVYKRQPMTG